MFNLTLAVEIESEYLTLGKILVLVIMQYATRAA